MSDLVTSSIESELGVPAEVFNPARLAAVRASRLMDTPAEENFDRLAALAASILRTPFGFVTIVDDTRSFWKSFISNGAAEAIATRHNPVEQTLSQYVIASGEPVVIDDTSIDPRAGTDPSAAAFGMAAWAGVPLRGSSGQILG